MFHPIKTAPELSQAITSTYLINIVIAIVFVLIMVLAVNLIKYQTGKKDNSGSKRRVCFFVIMVVSLIVCLVFNYFAFFKQISVAAFATKYTMYMVAAAIVSAVIYFGIGFMLVKMARIGTKLQSIFPKKDR